MPDLVSDEDDFELSSVGMNLTPRDFFTVEPYELFLLLLYSIISQIFTDAEEAEKDLSADVEGKPSATTEM